MNSALCSRLSFSSGNDYGFFIGAESDGVYPTGQYFDEIDEIKIEDISVTGEETSENNKGMVIRLAIVSLECKCASLSGVIFRLELLFNRV